MAEQPTTQFKKLTLREFKPDEFKVWEVAVKSTLRLNKLLGIVDGTDLDPTPRNPDGTPRAIPPQLRARVSKWEIDHERARDALISCLPATEILKLGDINASAIWQRLHDEYGRSSNLEYVRSSNALALLKKDDNTSMNDHINRFEQLVYDVNYNKPVNTPNLQDSVVNLKFLNTLMTDKASTDKWEMFINAKGAQLEQIPTRQLYAEVRVNVANKSAESAPDEAKALATELQQTIKALNTRFDDMQNKNKGQSSKRGRNQKRGQRGQRGEKGQYGKRGKRGNKKSRFPYYPDRYCEHHEMRGHSTEECNAAKREANESSNQHGNSNFKSAYQPSFNRPRDFTATVTRLIVNTAEAEANHKGDTEAWIVDTAANAYITPYKEKLQNYCEFTNRIRVKGFAGKMQLARGTGTITLTDDTGKRVTPKDVVYVPESPDQILSLIKLRRLQKANFQFTNVEEFTISIPNVALFSGNSINDICYIWTSPANTVNTVATRSIASKRPYESYHVEDNLNEQAHDTTPLLCSPQDLWHLRFGHASSTTLRKHPHNLLGA